MKLHALLRGIAGSMVLVSLALGYWASPWFFLLTVLVGFNLLQSAFTNTCPMMGLLRSVGVREEGAR